MDMNMTSCNVKVELTARTVMVRDPSGTLSNKVLAAYARSRVPGERLELRGDFRDRYRPDHTRMYTRLDNLQPSMYA